MILSISGERERGRSRTPKPTAVALELRRQQQHHQHQQHHRRIPNHTPTPPPKPPYTPPPKRAESPDRSIPGSLELAIQQSHARGDLRQCLQWVLEMQGIFLAWDDPRLDTATEDDLCFSEQTGMGADATPAERQRAQAYWAMRSAEDEARQRVWEASASPVQKEAARRLRVSYDAERRSREARLQFFRAPRRDKPASTLSLSRCYERAYTMPPRTTPSKPHVLFPVDDGEISAVREMWIDQGRRGFPLVEALLVRPPSSSSSADSSTKTTETNEAPSSDRATPSTSTSTSLSSSAPSALFSSVTTIDSVATSVETIASPDSQKHRTKSKVLSPRSASEHTQVAAGAKTLSKYVPVDVAESPLHVHLACVEEKKDKLEKETRDDCSSVEMDHLDCAQKQEQHRERRTRIRRRTRSISESWLSGFVDFIGRLPSEYLLREEAEEIEDVYPVTYHPLLASISISPSPCADTLIHMLPLRAPSHPLTFPTLPTLPRSPYRALTPPAQPTPRARLVHNPQFLRLKAVQNRVLWGLVFVPRGECEALADVARRHRVGFGGGGAGGYVDGVRGRGRGDVDGMGRMFTAREALVRVAVDGAGVSGLRYGWSCDAAGEQGRLWRWVERLF